MYRFDIKKPIDAAASIGLVRVVNTFFVYYKSEIFNGL